MTLNTLIGNHDWMGGLSKATTWDITGEKEGKPFNLGKQSGKITPFGISIIRHGTKYDKSTIFQGFPAKRPWYPFSSDIYQEVIPSIGDAYPYPVKALMFYMGSPVYALPAGHKLIEILSDPKKLPLFFTSDIVIGETYHVRRLYLPGPDLPGALGICRVAPLGDPQGGAFPVAGRHRP